MLTVDEVRTKLTQIIEIEYEEEVIVLKQTEDTRVTVTVEMFVILFGEAEFTYESLTQEKYEAYNYEHFFDEWKEKGLLE